MINMATVLKKVVLQLKNHASTNGMNIERSTEMNSNPGNDSWVGVYKGSASDAPYGLGKGARNWLTTGTLRIVIQQFDNDASDADELLEAKKDKVITALESDRTFANTVANVIGYSIEYSYTGKSEKDYTLIPFQYAIITVTFEVRS